VSPTLLLSCGVRRSLKSTPGGQCHGWVKGLTRVLGRVLGLTLNPEPLARKRSISYHCNCSLSFRTRAPAARASLRGTDVYLYGWTDAARSIDIEPFKGALQLLSKRDGCSGT